MQSITAAITGVAGYLPEYVLTNKELEQLVDTNDEWITSRTGIKERRLLKGEGKGSSVMAIEAVKSLLEKTNTDPLDVDLIIVATVTADHQFPATGTIVANHVGAKNAFAYDINAACSGFVYSLVTGSQFIETGKYKKVVVVGVDKMSSIIDYTDRATCVIFGDGAGAVLLEPDSEGLGIQDSLLHSDGSGIEYLHQKNGGSAYPLTEENIGDRDHFVHQEGQQVFKFAVTNMAKVASDIMERNQLTGDDVDWLVPHQANLRIIKATQDRMGVTDDKVMVNIQKYGNTTAGTIPLCLWDYESQLKKGDNIIIAAFGGGFTWGSIYLKWAYDSK